jgi:AcrR family transcriptional regulator
MTAKPTRADARRNYNRLLEVAKTAFARAGPEASLHAIAEEAGVGIGTLYRHFPTRESLVAAAFTGDIEQLEELALALARSNPPDAAVRTWLAAFAQHVANFRAVSSMFACSDATISTAAAAMARAATALIERAQEVGTIDKRVRPTDLIELANAIGWSTANVEQDEHHAERLLDLVMRGAGVLPVSARKKR